MDAVPSSRLVNFLMSGFRFGPRITSLIGAFLVVLSLTARAQSTPEAVSRQWMDEFNAGDMAKADEFRAERQSDVTAADNEAFHVAIFILYRSKIHVFSYNFED